MGQDAGNYKWLWLLIIAEETGQIASDFQASDFSGRGLMDSRRQKMGSAWMGAMWMRVNRTP
ncbi:hypothetical protein [Pseudophaeobacter sp.]|uniref:hypothetical protein n=1 Tax=Pseudophaeobacter sp. TaxID=1971739 RepID=UPI003A97D56E